MKPSSFSLFALGPLALATFLFWMGAPMLVQCDRIAAPRAGMALAEGNDDSAAARENVPPGRVDVTVHRRFLGLLPVRSDKLIDVVDEDSYRQRNQGRIRGGRRADAGSHLMLTLRDGREWTSPAAYSPVGTPPEEMAARIQDFIKNSSVPSLKMWCGSWLLHLLGVPLLLMGLFCAVAGLNVLRKNLRAGRNANAPFSG